MQKLRYFFKKPPPGRDRFNKHLDAMIKKMFPFVKKMWDNRTGRLAGLIRKKDYDFQQWSADFVQGRYRRWLRWGVGHFLGRLETVEGNQQIMVRHRPVSSLAKFGNYERCFNCPPSFCCYKIRHPRSVPAKNRKLFSPCMRPFCPFCQVRKALRRARRIMYAVKTVKSYYRNLHLFRYRVAYNSDATPDSLKEMAHQFVLAAKKNKSYLGVFWYIYPVIDRVNATVKWSLRILVVGGGSFEVPNDKVHSDIRLVEVLPARSLHIFQMVGKVMSSGRWPFWYDRDASPVAWDPKVHRRLSGSGCLHSIKGNASHSVFVQFRKHNHKKNRGKFLPFEWQTLANQ
jgi:hypothetical protein